VILITSTVSIETIPVELVNLTLQGGQFVSNGGGVYSNGYLTLTHVSVLNNTAMGAGAGVYANGVTAVDSRFENNHSAEGGGGLHSSVLRLTDTRFISNTATRWGGGAYAEEVTAVDSRFENNRTGGPYGGGGLYAVSMLSLTNTHFLHNHADYDGGGISLGGFDGAGTERLVNVLLAGNRAVGAGQAIYARHESGNNVLTILHSTIATPTLISGAAVVVQAGAVVISDTIITNHAVGIQRDGGMVTQDYNIFFGNTNNISGTVSGGGNSVVGNPAFANPAADDYRLTSGSASIDIGANVGIYTDFEDDVRPQGGGFDAGYDESPFVGARTLTVSAAGTGSGSVSSSPAGVTCGSDCTESYPHNTMVTLTATADAGSSFSGWWGSGCSGTETCTITMSSARAVTATFSLNNYALSVSKTGTGGGSVNSSPAGVTCGFDCTESYPYNTVVTLTATADVGSIFSSWGDSGCTGEGMCVLTMNNDKAVTATFGLNSYALTVSKAGAGNGAVSSNPAGVTCGITCTASFANGALITLTAAADSGSTFAGWSGHANGATNPVTVTMNMTKHVIATFTLSDDGDGVDAASEEGAPNDGDGNHDGMPDSQQTNVASLPAVGDSPGDYITIVAPASSSLANVTAGADPADAPFGISFPVGFVTFTVQSISPGASITVALFLPSGTDFNNYYKFGPTADNTTPHWYEFLYDGAQAQNC
jgi:hypothetical protein